MAASGFYHDLYMSQFRGDATPARPREEPDDHNGRDHTTAVSTPEETRQGFTAEQLQELLALIKDSDSVELKLTVPESDQRSTVDGARDRPARGADPAGLLLRHARPGARQAAASSSAPAGSRARATTRSSSCGRSSRRSCPDELRRSASFRVEVDALPGGFVCSATMKGTLRPDRRARARSPASCPLRKLFSKEQRAFFAAHAPEGIALDDLADPRPDLRAQAAVHAGGARAPARRRDVALPRRLARPRALDALRRRTRRSRSRPSCARSSPAAASTSRATSRRRPARRSSTSRSA